MYMMMECVNKLNKNFMINLCFDDKVILTKNKTSELHITNFCTVYIALNVHTDIHT